MIQGIMSVFNFKTVSETSFYRTLVQLFLFFQNSLPHMDLSYSWRLFEQMTLQMFWFSFLKIFAELSYKDKIETLNVW